MSDRPIIFDGPSVRAILAGTKTQTRLPLSPQPHAGVRYRMGGGAVEDGHGRPINPRYGVPGDRLWVRETFWVVDCPFIAGPHYLYAEEFERYSQGSFDEYEAGKSWAHLQGEDFWSGRSCGLRFGHIPSIHMPRWASRLTLEITDVRVQRLQDISEDDAKAEGVGHGFQMNSGWPDYRHIGADGRCSLTQDTAAMSFSTLWDSLNGKRAPWSSNPWIWAISFRVVA